MASPDDQKNWEHQPSDDGFVRPGIDDRPDYDNALTPEQKESVDKLSEPIMEAHPATPESLQNTDVQAVRMTEAAPAVAIAEVAESEPLNPESALNDMRDPMADASGHVPSRGELIRLGIGFTVSAVACAIPWVALNTIILPAVLGQIDDNQKTAMLGIVNAVGAVVALLANVIFGTLSDLTRSKRGKRCWWIITGGVVAGVSVGLISITRNFGFIVLLWSMAQLGYNIMLAPFVATMSDRVPDKVRGTISGFYGAGIAVGQTLGNYVGASLIKQGASGIFAGWMMGFGVFSLIGIITVAIWPADKSNVDQPRDKFSVMMILRSFRPPLHAPDFYYALSGRTLMMGGYWMINSYQLYICQDYIFSDQTDAVKKAAAVIATMSLITLGVSLFAAVTAGPITDRIHMRKIPVALASCLFAVGAAMPLLFHSPLGMYLFAGIAGLGYGIYNAIDQALNVAVLPNPEEAGKDLGILNLANTLSTVIGSVFTSVILGLVRGMTHSGKVPGYAYVWVFIIAIILVLVAAYLIMRIKKVR